MATLALPAQLVSWWFTQPRATRLKMLALLGGLVCVWGLWRATAVAPQAQQKVIIKRSVTSLFSKAAVFSPDGKYLVGSNWGTLRVWSRTGTAIKAITLSRAHINDIAYSADNSMIAVAGLKTFILDASTFTQIRQITPGAEDFNDLSSSSDRVMFSPDGTKLLVTSSLLTNKQPVRLYDVHTGQLIMNWPVSLRQTASVISAIFSPDGTKLLSAGASGTATLWDAIGGGQIRTLPGNGSTIDDIAFSPNGRTIALADDDTMVTLWDTASGALLQRIEISSVADRVLLRRPYAHVHNWTSCVAFSPDGKRVAAGGTDASAGVWDVATGEQLFALNGHTDAVQSITFSPDGNQVMTSSEDDTIRVWDVTAT